MPLTDFFPLPSKRLALAGGLLACLAGAIGLGGYAWALIPGTSWGQGFRPPSLSAAQCFLLLGAAAIQLTLPRLGRVRAVRHLAGIAAVLTLVVMAFQWAGHPLDLEHPGLVVPDHPSGFGHMTHTTGLGVLMAALGLGGLTLRSRQTAGWTGLLSGLILLLLSLLLGLAHVFGVPQVLGEAFVHSSLAGTFGLLGLGLATVILSMEHLGASPGSDASGRPVLLRLMALGVLLFVVLVGGSFFGYRAFERQQLAELARELSTIAELKADSLSQYRKERLLDAAILSGNATLARLVENLFEGRGGRRELLTWIDHYVTEGEFDLVRLVDPTGRVHAQFPEGPPLSATLRQTLQVCLSERRTIFQDFYRSENDGRIRLAVLVPILREDGRPVGGFVLRMDPYRYLYPFLQRWPVPTRTGEVVLARREGDEVVVLNPTRKLPETALTLRRPIRGWEHLPLVQAALGKVGWMMATDFQGKPVAAHIGAVPHSPWFLLLRLDAEEAHAGLRSRLRQMLALDALLCAVLAASLGLLWRQQRVRLLAERLQREQERRRFEAQLARSQKMESLGSLAGGVAHDMNNVLGAILGLASAHASLQPAGSSSQKAFETIEKAARRGGTLVRGLLDFTRKGLVEEAAVDLNTLVQEEVHLLERTTLSRVDCVLSLDPQLRPIRGDAGALSHVLMNLCVNAVDAMPQGGTLTLRTRNLPGDRVELQVADTGAGMTPEVLEKALEPFFTTKDQGKGTGLGLSIVYGTVKAHGGSVELQSQPGEGTTVTLGFPALATAATEIAQKEPSGIHDARKTVLLVDDDDLVRTATEALLGVLGHAVVAVPSGEEALAQLEAGLAVDLVLLDLNMPGLGGPGTLPRLRAAWPHLPVLLATGRADHAALALAKAHPGVGLMAKPFSLQELRRAIAATSA